MEVREKGRGESGKSVAEATRRFPFDTVLLAINAADPHRLGGGGGSPAGEHGRSRVSLGPSALQPSIAFIATS